MVLFDKKEDVKGYEIVREGKEDVMRINCERCNYVPSLENNAICMAESISKLLEAPHVSRVIFVQRRNYQYDYDQVQLLIQIASIYNHLAKQRRFIGISLDNKYLGSKTVELQNLLDMLKGDPIGTYVSVRRILREEKIILRKLLNDEDIYGCEAYIKILNEFYNLLDRTKLITIVKPRLDGYNIGDRSLYAEIFRAIITPDFMFARLMARVPLDGEEIASYKIDKYTDVSVFKVPGDIKYLYHLNPPEFKISEDKYELLDMARSVLIKHKPRAEDFIDPDKMRMTFFNIGKDLLQELAERQGLNLNYSELKDLTNILVRYTVGFGLIEVLLRDEKVQDITINSPIGQTPIFIVHQDFEECVTNIIPSQEDAQSWATKFRMLSGRALDEANPILDTELILPEARARVAIVSNPLSPWGLAYAFRRHRDKPWTLPLFIENRMISPLAAGLISFLVDGARSMLIAGTRSSGKTSLLGSVLVEIMRKYRVITCEDSVVGDSELLIKRNGKFERTTIGNLIDILITKYGCWYNLSEHEILGNDENIELYSMNKEGKINLSKATKFIRHNVQKTVYEITTRTGRKIKVTEDHSLFGLKDKAKISEIKAKDLKEKDYIAVPRFLPSSFKGLRSINLLEYLDKLEKGFFTGESIKVFLRKNKYEVGQLSKEHGYAKCTFYRWLRKGIIPTKILKDMYCLSYRLNDFEGVYYKSFIGAKKLPVLLELDENLLTLLGLWIADGCYDLNSVIFSVVEEENREIVRNVAKKCNLNVRMHSDTFSLIINSSTLKLIMREILDLKGSAYTKRIPSWMFNLSREQLSFILKGLFSGDGCMADKEIVIPLSSLNLLKDIQLILLQFGIILRIGSLRKDKTYNAAISTLRDWKLFRNFINILPLYKKEKLNLLCNKISTHDTTDIIPLDLEDKKEICSILKSLKCNDYTTRNNNIGRNKLTSILQGVEIGNEFLQNINILINSDLLWDQIKEIKKINFDGYVYDISVPVDESFITNNIVAHNTLELPTDSLRQLGYNIQPMKVRSALTSSQNEIAADEGIRSSLRMGDSALIVGEIRSLEAKALYEAMRIGALANVVAGTIHGESPYGVYDRVVNDLQVPKTSFKATDLIILANPIKSPDGLQKWKRVLQITEVRKTWEEDPLRENGFVDLMKYDTKTDSLKPTDELINGNSEIIKNVAANVSEWVGNWDAVWDNIILRAKIKEALVNYSRKVKNRNILEAGFTILANDQFHKICNSVKEDIGYLESRRIYFEWEDWLKRAIKK